MIAFILAAVLFSSVTEATNGLTNPLLEVQAANLGKYGPHIEASTMTSLQQLLAETGKLFLKEFDSHRVTVFKYGPLIEASTMTSLQQLLSQSGNLFHKGVDPHRVPDYFPDGIKANFNEVAGQSLADVKDDGTAKSQKPVV